MVYKSSTNSGGGGGGSGTVTSLSVVTANGLAGTVANPTTTPALTLSTTITGLLKGNGTAVSAAVADADYQNPISLTTTGIGGAATFSGDTINIPQYASPLKLNPRSGGYLTNSTSTSASITFAINTLIAFPVTVSKSCTALAVSFAPVIVTTTSYKTALYADNNGVPGTIVAGTAVTSSPLTTATITSEDNTFSSPVALTPGLYWMAIKTDTSGTITAEGSTSAVFVFGALDATGASLRYSVADTYANALSGSFPGSPTFNAGNTPKLYLKIQ